MGKSLQLPVFFVFALLSFSLSGPGFAAPAKVTICHLPSGNPDNAQTITVGESAAQSHLTHGDLLGPCPSGCTLDPTACNDGNLCTSDVCLSGGECAHVPVDCDDGNVCTQDLCVESLGCVNVPDDGLLCDDGNACTSGDSCSSGHCAGTPESDCCIDSDDCNDGNSCTQDQCVAGSCTNTAVICPDVEICNLGICNPSGYCDIVPVSCDDGNICTDDYCDLGAGCVSEPTPNPPEEVEISCADGLDNDCDGLVDETDADCVFVCGDGERNGDEECEGADLGGQTCVSLGYAGGTLVCSASCQLDPTLCRHPNGDACESDGACDSNYCVDGVCCESACNGDCRSCNLSGQEGACALQPTGTQCEGDGNLCTVDECNESGVCTQVGPVQCAPPDPPCEGGQECDPSSGECVDLTQPADGEICHPDGNLCAYGGCYDGTCIKWGLLEQCESPDPVCGGGSSCNPLSGECEPDPPSAPEGTPCEADESVCTIDVCDSTGQCLQSASVECGVSQSCDPYTGDCSGVFACDSGPFSDQACTQDQDCWTCSDLGDRCSDDSDCKICNYGPAAGERCNVDFDCGPGTCKTDFYISCNSSNDCPDNGECIYGVPCQSFAFCDGSAVCEPL